MGRHSTIDGATQESVFIVGPARSGTTLLYKALCLHPQVAYISNWRSRFPWLPSVTILNRLAPRMSSLQRRVWFGAGSNAYAYGRARSTRDRLFPTPVEGEPVYTRAGVARPGGPAPASVDPKVAMTAAFDSIRTWGNGSCVVSKRIANNLRIPLLHDVFPNARFVVLVRDGRAVAESLSRVDWWNGSFVWWYGGTPEQWQKEGGDPWVICARNWVEELEAIEIGLETAPADQVIRIRYEDLVEQPSQSFEWIAKQLSLAEDDGWSANITTLPISDRNDLWRHRLERSVVDTITRIQRPVLERYGYAI